jgi:hypothetical protein
VICLNYRGHDGDQTLLSDFTEADLVDDTAEFMGCPFIVMLCIVASRWFEDLD